MYFTANITYCVSMCGVISYMTDLFVYAYLKQVPIEI